MAEELKGVETALEMVREELAAAVKTLREQAGEAFKAGDTSTFDRLKERLDKVEGFQQKLAALLREWAALARGRAPSRVRRKPPPKRGPHRARPGELLHEKEYVFPILQALKEMGGSAAVRDVIRAVGRTLKGKLKSPDYERLQGGDIRWENRARWVRDDLLKAGLLASGSPTGIWEITEEGLRHLEASDLEATWNFIKEAQRERGGRSGHGR